MTTSGELPPIPIEIKRLAGFIKSHRVTCGKRNFDKVITIGVIRECTKIPEHEGYQLTVADPKDESCNIQAFKYTGFGSKGDSNTPEMFEEETTVFLGGKLSRFNNVDGLLLFAIRELEDPEEYDCLALEAKLAEDFHTKASNAPGTPRADFRKSSTSAEQMKHILPQSLMATPPFKKKEEINEEPEMETGTKEELQENISKDSFNRSTQPTQKSTFDWSQ